ncbi:DUF5655 domain-containing protein [Adhaeribacter arboris]|uniref:DUF5655 domain-containing protein n=1 Tax=Adhaeribacter arboris TaxID=2072846 RepID=UPI001E2B4D49|nr:DUF5655 domain-containing protein [Adhaeribacter arboris]
MRFRRKKQFATLQPAIQTCFKTGINLKGQKAQGKLEAILATNVMGSHKMNLADLNDLDQEVIRWIKTAYANVC